MKDLILQRFEQSISVQEKFFKNNLELIEDAIKSILQSLRSGGKIMILGNGGSAADAQHLAAEFINRYLLDRRPLPAIALTTDSSILTSIANDFAFEEIFSKQIQALGKPGDIVIAISTSGNSPNIVKGVEMAKKMGIYVIALTGGSGGEIKDMADLCLCVSSSSMTQLIQETHLILEHVICELVEKSIQ